jgi:serine/threonine protein phosphatase PrpC
VVEDGIVPLRIEVFAETSVGMKREDNEDNLGLLHEHGVFVVADGMGGHSGGELASRLAIEAVRDHYASTQVGDPRHEAARLDAAIQLANTRIIEAALKDRTKKGMGTTIVAAAARGHGVHVAHVGDSRVYRIRHKGIELLTQDHSLVNDLVRAGRIKEEEAANFSRKNLVTRALGLKATVKVDARYEPVKDGDILLLCSDGLSGVVPDESILDIVHTAGTVRNAAAELVHMANTRGGPDNVTVMLIRWSER